MKTRVQWTSREWQLLAGFFILNQLDVKAYRFKNNLREAQLQCLPANRRRNVDTAATSIRGPLSKEIEMLKVTRELSPEPEPVPEVSQVPTIETASLDELIQAIANKISKSVFDQLTESFKKVKHNPEYSVAEKVNRFKVLVVGPINGQQQELLRDHPDLDLRFVASSDSPNLVTIKGKECDVLLLWTTFIGHPHQKNAQAVKTAKIEFVTGRSLNVVHEKLNQIVLGVT